jgi:hypothetical protein
LACADRLADLAARCTDSELRRRVADAWIDASAYRWHTYETVTKMTSGEKVGSASSLMKLFWSEMDLDLHRTALELLGERAYLEGDPAAASWTKGYQFALAGPIYAGTNEIQRNIVAERVLGLPRR